MSDRPTSVATIAPREFCDCLGRFAIGVTVMTTEVYGKRHGMTANGVLSISLAPPLALISGQPGPAIVKNGDDADRYHALVNQCLRDYDLGGWMADCLKDKIA